MKAISSYRKQFFVARDNRFPVRTGSDVLTRSNDPVFRLISFRQSRIGIEFEEDFCETPHGECLPASAASLHMTPEAFTSLAAHLLYLSLFSLSTLFARASPFGCAE